MLFIDGSIERRKMRISNGGNQNKMEVDEFTYGTSKVVAAMLFFSYKTFMELSFYTQSDRENNLLFYAI